MAKRKYTRFGETPVAYQCTNRKCKWEGKQDEKLTKETEDGWSAHVCPNCSKDEFYGLLEEIKKN